MATPSKTKTVKDAEPTEPTEGVEGTEGAVEKRTRRNPVKTFVVMDDLPENPKRKVAEGFGTSKWVKILADFVAAAPADKWVQVQEYPTPGGARLAQKNLQKKVDDGESPFPEGYTWETAVRRVDVEVDGVSERHSLLFIKYS